MTSETIATLLGGGVLGYMAQAFFKFLNSRKAMDLTNEEKLRSELQEQPGIALGDPGHIFRRLPH